MEKMWLEKFDISPWDWEGQNRPCINADFKCNLEYLKQLILELLFFWYKIA